MPSIRQEQVAEMIKRHFSRVLQEQGSYVYGNSTLVTVTTVQISPDFSLAKIYLSVYNTDNKQEVILMMENEATQLRHALSQRLRKKLRRIPFLNFYLDDTLDEMYRLREVFDRIKKNDGKS
jgi:ribosome-binding factor A